MLRLRAGILLLVFMNYLFVLVGLVLPPSYTPGYVHLFACVLVLPTLVWLIAPGLYFMYPKACFHISTEAVPALC